MPSHNLRQLSPRDFEELIRDLLQAEWNVTLEAFKVGRDKGIDLRHIPVDKGATIVQCKHYATAGFAKLLVHLRSRELEKVKKLNPARYVLVTSVGLTPPNKETIAALFAPYVLSPNDIYGADDIDGLLSRHDRVARAHFKLWLTNTEILERVLHNAEKCQTEFEVERVTRKLPIFVQSAAFPRAQRILDKTRVLVISGVPGIGKTTLAEMLLYAHLEEGYEPAVIQTDVREGKGVFDSKRPQIFYFDDFLGQTFLGENRFPGGMNSDRALVDFVEMIKATDKSRFILTTREHLLQSARAVSERLLHSSLLDHRCLLELSDYSNGQRARILYNHLYFSDLPREMKEEVLRDDFFLEVVKHEHFSPRLIEWLSAAPRLREVPAAHYRAHIRSILASPERIWSHAFNQQISVGARNALLVLYSVGGLCEQREFEPLWSSFHTYTASKYGHASEPKTYQRALRELDSAFVSYSRGSIQFLNPSVGEMVAHEIADSPEYAVDLVASAGRFNQITKLVDLSQQDDRNGVKNALAKEADTLMKSVVRLLRTPHVRWDTTPDGQRGIHIDLTFETRLARIGEMAHVFQLATLRGVFESEVGDLAVRYRKGSFDMDYARSLIGAFDERPYLKTGNGATLQRALLDAILADTDIWWAERLNTLIACSKEVSIWSAADDEKLDAAIAHYQKKRLRNEYDDCRDADDYERLRDDLTTLGENLGVPFTKEIELIEERLAELESRHDDEYRGGGAVRTTADFLREDGDSDDAIRDVFGTLLD